MFINLDNKEKRNTKVTVNCFKDSVGGFIQFYEGKDINRLKNFKRHGNNAR